MIKFFRKIRYDLIEKNKTGKYLKYAIGEIILVVVGILIALQINNWNENRKNRLLEKELLKEIKLDLVTDTIQMNGRFYRAYNDLVKSIRVYDSITKLDDLKIDVTYLDSIFKRCIRQRSTFFPTSGTYSSIVSNGNSNIFSNKKLFKEIQNLYDFAYRVTLESGNRIDNFSDKIRYQYNYIETLSNSERLILYKKPKIRNEIDFWFNEYNHFKGLIDFNLDRLNKVFPKIDEEITN